MYTSDSLISVLIIDDHAVFREGLAAQINAEPDMTIVGEAADADAGIDEATRTRPSIILMDIDLPGLSAFAAADTIVAQLPDVRIIFLSAFSNEVYIAQALQAKAWGYITKSEPFTTVRQAIRDVAKGWVHFSNEIKSRMVNAPEGPRLAAKTTSRASRLTLREVELLRYVAKGMSVKEIAGIMHISPKTVDNHKTSLMGKLDIHDRVDLARFAFREGIATP